jgi:N-acetylglucosaminyldiphosphoundecaprenol N-acetyl-beta-D-mannosaminyltransferase
MKGLMGLRLDPVDRRGIFDFIRGAIRDGRRVTITHLNVHAVNTAHDDAAFRAVNGSSDLVYCDGIGVRLAARLAGLNVRERVTATDWIFDYCREFASERLFYVGHHENVLEPGLGVLRGRAPGLIASGHHGHFEKSGPENEKVLAAIHAFRPAVVMVGMGMPVQERWIRDNREHIEAPVVIAVGALLEWVCGAWRRSPDWVNRSGGEWLARLVTQPRHTWRRYVIGNPLFVARFVAHLLLG